MKAKDNRLPRTFSRTTHPYWVAFWALFPPLLGALVLESEFGALRQVFSYILLYWLPGFALVRLAACRIKIDKVSLVFLALPFSILLVSGSFMALYLARASISPFMAVSIAAILSSGIGIASAFTKTSSHLDARQPSAGVLLAVFIVLAAAAGLRLLNLGYSEFQGDEAGNCLLNSLRVVTENYDVLTS